MVAVTFSVVFFCFVVFTSIELSLSQDASAIDTLSTAFSGLVYLVSGLLSFHLAQAEVETL